MHTEVVLPPVLAGERDADTISAAEGTPDAPPEQLSQEQLLHMSLDMFFGDPAGPRATGEAGPARASSLGLLQDADAVRNVLWGTRKADIKALFAPAPTEKKEVLGHVFEPHPHPHTHTSQHKLQHATTCCHTCGQHAERGRQHTRSDCCRLPLARSLMD